MCTQDFLEDYQKDSTNSTSEEEDDDDEGLLALQRSVTEYAKQNVALVTVFIRDPYAAHYVGDEKITEIAFVGTVGGLLGLFLGFSFVSVVEFGYLVVIGGKKNVGNAITTSGGISDVSSRKSSTSSRKNLVTPHQPFGSKYLKARGLGVKAGHKAWG